MDVITRNELSELQSRISEASIAGDKATKDLATIADRISKGAHIEPGFFLWHEEYGLGLHEKYWLGTSKSEGFVPYGNCPDLLRHLRNAEKPLPERRGMGARERSITWLCVAIIVAMRLYPPWTLRSGYAGGHGFIFAAPPAAAHIDLLRLGVQWILAVVIAGALHFTWPGKDPVALKI